MLTDTQGHGLGRVVSPPDERDGAYPALRAFGTQLQQPERRHRKHYTQHTRHFSQGNIGQCTMYSAGHLVSAGPVTQRPYRYMGEGPHFNTVAAYCRAQSFDRQAYGWRLPTYCQDPQRGDNGATMRSAAQVLRELGFISNFWWLRTQEELALYVTNVAPAWVGTVWTANMSVPDSKGFLRPTGREVGGHAYILDEIVWERLGDRVRYYWMLNTWFPWGLSNRAKIEREAMADLLAAQGEALGVTEVRR